MKVIRVCPTVRVKVYEFGVVPTCLVLLAPLGLGKRPPRCKKRKGRVWGLSRVRVLTASYNKRTRDEEFDTRKKP